MNLKALRKMSKRTIWDENHTATMKRLRDDSALTFAIHEKWAETIDAYKRVAFQRPKAASTLPDKYITLSMISAIERGEVAALRIPVSGPACADEDEAGNQAVLDSMPAPFYGMIDRKLSAGMLDCDGVVGWNEPITLNLGAVAYEVQPAALPLEVGTMPSGKMQYAIAPERGTGMARLPYGLAEVWLIVPRHVVLHHTAPTRHDPQIQE